MKKRAILILISAATVSTIIATIKLTYYPIAVWYADARVIGPYLAGNRDEFAPPAYVERMTIDELTAIGIPGVEAILRRLPQEDVSYPVGPCCWLLLNVARDVPGSMPLLLRNVNSNSVSVRCAVALALGYQEERGAALPHLRALAGDAEESVRSAATFSLAEMNVRLLGPNLSRDKIKRVTVDDPTTIGLPGVEAIFQRLPQEDDRRNADDTLPNEKTNCVRCHLTAGRELTAPVRDFARSVHDLAKMSCNDCHGGNTEDDTTAHAQEFDFIGNKLSAHMAACADCHTDEAQSFRKGPHFWDQAKRINHDYPVCIDCHGNHDVGKPPPDFSLMNVCTDCHKTIGDTYPEVAAIVAENDRLWAVLRQVHAKSDTAGDPTPPQFRRELSRVRSATARLMHPATRPTKEQADSLNARAERLRKDLEAWH